MDNFRASIDVDIGKNQIKKILKKAPTSESLYLISDGTEIYLVLNKHGKPLAKVSAAWALNAITDYADDMKAEMEKYDSQD